MSVIKNKRTLSEIEYIDFYMRLYDEFLKDFEGTAKRKRRWIIEPLIARLNHLLDGILQTGNQFYNYGIKLKDTAEQADVIIRQIRELQKPLIVYWNIERMVFQKMARQADKLNSEIKLVEIMAKRKPSEDTGIYVLDHYAAEKFECLKQMQNLHRYIYSKMISSPLACRETKGVFLLEMADTALYCLVEANRKIPETAAERDRRTENIETAMSCLKNMEVPVVSYFNLMQYSDRVMTEWAGMMADEMKLLNGLKKSDSKRFSDL